MSHRRVFEVPTPLRDRPAATELQVWTPEGFKPAAPRPPRRAPSRVNQRDDSLNVLLNRYMDPKEEREAQRKEAETQAKRQRRFEGTSPAKIRERQSNPLTLEHERYADRVPNPDHVYSRYAVKRSMDRARYDPISHHYMEPGLDNYVRAAESQRRETVAAIKQSRSSGYDPLIGVNADGTPASPELRRGKAHVPSTLDVDSTRVLSPGPMLAEFSERRRQTARKMTASNAGYNPLSYDARAVSPHDPNRNGIVPVSTSRGAKSNRSGTDYPILEHAPPSAAAAAAAGGIGGAGTGRVVGGTRRNGYDPISRTASTINRSRASFNILTGAPLAS